MSTLHVSIANKYFCWALILFPVAVMYSIFNVPLPYLIIVIGLALVVITKKPLLLMGSYWTTVFFCYMAVVPSLIYCLSMGSVLGLVQTGTWLFLLYILLFYEYVEKEYLELTYKRVLVAVILFFLFQELIYQLSGSRISGIIPFLTCYVRSISYSWISDEYEIYSQQLYLLFGTPYNNCYRAHRNRIIYRSDCFIYLYVKLERWK